MPPCWHERHAPGGAPGRSHARGCGPRHAARRTHGPWQLQSRRLGPLSWQLLRRHRRSRPRASKRLHPPLGSPRLLARGRGTISVVNDIRTSRTATASLRTIGDYLEVVQVQQRRGGEPGREDQVEVDVQPSRNDPQGRERPLAYEGERADDGACSREDDRRATTEVQADDDESSSEGILGKLVPAKRNLPARRPGRGHRLTISRGVAQFD